MKNATKNNTMKNFSKNVIVAFVALALTFSVTSCKKGDEPTPSQPAPTNNGGGNNGGGTGGTNHAPTFSSTFMKVASNGSAQTFTLPVSDSDGNTITITGITGASSNVTVSYSGLDVTVTPNNSIFAGAETLSITVTDGTTPTTSSFTVNVGETAQITSYNILSLYHTQTLDGGFKIMSNGTITGGDDADFYESGSTSATYKILSNGNIEVHVAGLTIQYSFAGQGANHLEFTLISTTNSSYNSKIGSTFMF